MLSDVRFFLTDRIKSMVEDVVDCKYFHVMMSDQLKTKTLLHNSKMYGKTWPLRVYYSILKILVLIVNEAYVTYLFIYLNEIEYLYLKTKH